MSTKLQFYLIIVISASLGIGLTLYKSLMLGFPLTPGQRESAWIVEARISFEATGVPVNVSLAIPEDTPNYTIQSVDIASANYGFTKTRSQDGIRAIWSARSATGPQKMYYRINLVKSIDARPESLNDPPIEQPSPYFAEPYLTAADALLETVRQRSADSVTFTGELLQRLNQPRNSQNVSLLLRNRSSPNSKIQLALDLLTRAGISARKIRGLKLKDGHRKQSLYDLIEIFHGSNWICFDPRTGESGLPNDFIIWQRGGRSLLDIEGGTNSKVYFSIIKDVHASFELAMHRAAGRNAALIDFSIYSLPIEEQNAFKLLLLVPIGALVVVIMRNLIGVPTSGTFMPILIAIAFKQTALVNGLILFCIIISAGLYIRFYLSRLNLLLVPRISAVVIIVILLMAMMSILSYKLGLHQGLRITFFPMIILAWTIERMSIIWEEQGYKEALTQGAGSLFVASIAYLSMENTIVEHLTFSFPELILVILSAILIMGNYTGYRLTELYRFHSLAKS